MSHVRIPKFGSWDSENVGYTTLFESARKERANGARMSPNNPERNLEAFMSLQVDVERQRTDGAGKPSLHFKSKQPKEKRQGKTRTTPARTPLYSESSLQSFHSDSGSEKAFLQQDHTGEKVCLSTAHHSFSHWIKDSHTTVKSGTSPLPHENVVATVPEFGSWDETDPRSGDDFSIIFNKLKEEKHIAPTNLRSVHQEPTNYSKSQCRHGNSFFSKICCCRS